MQPVTEERAAMRAACAAAGGPGTKEGWAALWQKGMTMWDLKGPTAVLYSELVAEVAAGRLQLHLPALVPGCGSGYDVKGLYDAGMRGVVGCDIAEEAIARAQGVLGEAASPSRLLCALAFPLASDELAADPAAPGPPHPVSLQAYRSALEPHGLRLESGPRSSPKSVRAQEQVVWWSKPQ